MKKISCLLLILVGFTISYAQEKAVQKADFEAMLSKATEILKAKPHRMTVISRSDVNGKPQETASSKTIVEVVSADKRRSVREYKSADKNFKREYIRFGGKTYSRENEGKWTQAAMPNDQTPDNMKKLDEQFQYQSLGTEKFGGQNASVYRRVKMSKMVDNSNNEEIQSTETVKYWMGADGALLKREMERENKRGGKVFHFTVAATFDYDPSIQITAPGVQ
jgi:hypothetical protein